MKIGKNLIFLFLICCSFTNAQTFRLKDSCKIIGDKSLRNYSFSFRARNPENADQVQIWAGFRTSGDFDRYMVGIKGGLLDEVYLMRVGYMGNDDFMGERPLRFHPLPGQWLKIKVQACEGRIRVFVGDEPLPYIDVTDKNYTYASSGPVQLGGGWIETEYTDVDISPLSTTALDVVPDTEYSATLVGDMLVNQSSLQMVKDSLRRKQRCGYKPIVINDMSGVRQEISLDGSWLFMPDYQNDDKNAAISASSSDENWHVMPVPAFWNPVRIWLHGETMSSPKGGQPKGVSDRYYQQETDRCAGYTFDYKRTKSAWYRQWVTLPEKIKGKAMTLSFDAVSKMADIYVNGQLAASHIGMFGEINIDATRLLHPGENLIAVKVTRDFVKDIGDADKIIDVAVTVPVTNKMVKDIAHGFYGDDPAGIWQHVSLVVTNQQKVDDVFIQPSTSGASFDVLVSNHAPKETNYSLETTIVDKFSGEIIYSGVNTNKRKMVSGSVDSLHYDICGLKPKLWEPGHPNLYDFHFKIRDAHQHLLDDKVITSGFRTFEVKNGLFYLNGRPYWLRGGNQTPSALAPNDTALADKFMTLMREGNILCTRTHTAPFNEVWMDAADRNGIGVSFEGTWPWLMINNTMPDAALIKMWSEEFLSLLKKYRNHPSLIFWTVNNEMKFYDNDENKERAKSKFCIISDVVKRMRKIDPTRPICFDSNYQEKGKNKKFGSDFMSSVDDGDIDDVHAYYNWYDYSMFRFFNGEFQKQYKLSNRPLISQEMSTGYPNNETGHPTRSYQLIHQNPYSLVGYKCYDWSDPSYFLHTQSFITEELAEALRRTCDKTSGILHFSLLSWFRQPYDSKNIHPWPTYYSLKRALQPVLVSAELWGRHLYAGDSLKTRIYVVNDDEQGRDLPSMKLHWQLVDEQNNEIASDMVDFPAVPYYGRKYIESSITIPSVLKADKINAKLKLILDDGIKVLSQNEYDLLLASREWPKRATIDCKRVVLLDGDGMERVLKGLHIQCKTVSTMKELLKIKSADLRIISGMTRCNKEESAQLRNYQRKGENILYLNSKEVAQNVYPDYITGWIIPSEGDIVLMERENAPVFDGIGVLDLRYFNNNKREIPLACNSTLKIVRNNHVIELASQMKIHAYIDGGSTENRMQRIKSMRGLTLLQIDDAKGKVLVSTLCTEKADTDPVAGKLLVNMISLLLNDK